jgi:hypothetical protein
MPSSAASIVEGMARAPYARDVAAVDEEIRHAIGQAVRAALHAYRDGDEVVIPHRSHLVQAQVASSHAERRANMGQNPVRLFTK